MVNGGARVGDTDAMDIGRGATSPSLARGRASGRPEPAPVPLEEPLVSHGGAVPETSTDDLLFSLSACNCCETREGVRKIVDALLAGLSVALFSKRLRSDDTAF